MIKLKQVLPSAPRKVIAQKDVAYRALKEDKFVPFFQPLVTLRTGQLAGFEVLARWQHPAEGIILPDRFIVRAEQDGWIDELTRQILKKAFAAAVVLPEDLTLSINISPVQLRDVHLPEAIRCLAQHAGFSLSRLIVEVTESALIDNLYSAVAIVSELKAIGCRLSLDDFGTGYSSLLHLQSLPFEELKVDRSFVSSMTTCRESRKIVSAVVGLGHSLGLTTVAEGIETQEQAEMMLWLGCELGQGYFYGQAVPEVELAGAITRQRQKLVTHPLSAWRRISASDLDVSPSQRLAQLQAVYDGAPIGLAFIDQNWQYLSINKRLSDMNGASVDAHLRRQVSDMIPDLFPHVEPYIRRALGGEVITDVEARLPNTQEIRCISYQPALDEAGEVIGVALAVSDITERKLIERALQESEAHYRSMVQLNPQVLWVMDPQGRNLDVSPRWDKTTGLMLPTSSDHDWLKSLHPDDLQPAVRSIAESRRNGAPIRVQYRVADGAGGWQWKQSMGAPRFDISGNIVCWYGSVEDIKAPELKRNPVPEAKPCVVPARSQAAHLTDVLAKSGKRQKALLDLDIIDTPAEAEFDDLVALASELCSAPISLVSLLDSDRQWFKASVGLSAWETPITSSFCLHAVEQQGLFMVKDATADHRFEQNPLVIGSPHVRFYAGAPLYGADGEGIGTLCVIDTVPRSLAPSQAKALIILSQQVQARLELRYERKRLSKALAEKEQLLRERSQGLSITAMRSGQSGATC